MGAETILDFTLGDATPKSDVSTTVGTSMFMGTLDSSWLDSIIHEGFSVTGGSRKWSLRVRVLLYAMGMGTLLKTFRDNIMCGLVEFGRVGCRNGVESTKMVFKRTTRSVESRSE